MYTSESIIQILITIIIAAGITYFVLSFIKTNTIKVMLLGIGIIIFAGLTLKDKVQYGLDEVLSVIGIGIILGGFIRRD
jgi:hypothetical protein